MQATVLSLSHIPKSSWFLCAENAQWFCFEHKKARPKSGSVCLLWVKNHFRHCVLMYSCMPRIILSAVAIPSR
ncbi:Uncharacterised protein [Citrobacter koseri]|nr:Uncharacterised protein [Citrobacter koseri]